jgi:hypothetical protein
LGGKKGEKKEAGSQWFMPVVLATQETEIRSEPGQTVHETLSWKKTPQ